MYFFFFNDTATTEIYTLSLHDALPIYKQRADAGAGEPLHVGAGEDAALADDDAVGRNARGELLRDGERGLEGAKVPRSEEHTSELQSRQYLVCRLLLEKKKPAHLRSPR